MTKIEFELNVFEFTGNSYETNDESTYHFELMSETAAGQIQELFFLARSIFTTRPELLSTDKYTFCVSNIIGEIPLKKKKVCFNSESHLYPNGMVFTCSLCGESSYDGQPDYCPNCGAKVFGCEDE